MYSSRPVQFALVFLFVFGWKMSEALDLVLLGSFWLILVAARRYGLSWMTQGAVVAFAYLLMTWSALVTAALSPEDAYYLNRGIRSFVNILGAGGLALLLIEHCGSPAAALRRGAELLVAAVSAHALVVFAMFANPGLREAIYAITGAARYVNETSSFLAGFRIPGLTYGLSQTSVLHAFGALLAFALFLESRLLSLRWCLLLVAFVLSGASILVIGRSGLVALAGGVALLLAYWARRQSFGVMAGRFAAIGGFVLLAGLALGALGVGGARSAEDESALGKFNYYTLTHAFELIELVTTGDSETTDVLGRMFFLPESASGLVLGGMGSGREGRFYIPSDSGYIRMIFGIGFVGLGLCMAVYFAIARAALRAGGILGLVLGYFAIVILVFHVKELALLTRNQLSAIALVYWLVYLGAPARVPRRRHAGGRFGAAAAA